MEKKTLEIGESLTIFQKDYKVQEIDQKSRKFYENWSKMWRKPLKIIENCVKCDQIYKNLPKTLKKCVENHRKFFLKKWQKSINNLEIMLKNEWKNWSKIIKKDENLMKIWQKLVKNIEKLSKNMKWFWKISEN